MTYEYHATEHAARAAVERHRATGQAAYFIKHHHTRWEVRSWR